MIRITLEVTDPELLEDYKDIHPELIADDFRNNPQAWLDKGKLTIRRGRTITDQDIPSVKELVEYILTYDSDTFNARRVGLTLNKACQIADKLISNLITEIDGITLQELFDQLDEESEDIE